MKFYQVLTTNEHTSSLDIQYTSVFNYATLAEAMRDYHLHKVSEGDGVTYTEAITGRTACQHQLVYEEKGGAVIELRTEYADERGYFHSQRSLLIKEIIL